MELFNKALFLSQQKIFAITHRRVYTLMVNLFQILNQFVLLFRKNVIEKSSMIWRVLPLVKINTRISETPYITCIGCSFKFVDCESTTDYRSRISCLNLTSLFVLFVFLLCRLMSGAFTIDSSTLILRRNLNEHPTPYLLQQNNFFRKSFSIAC
jgi:hypothetical protein